MILTAKDSGAAPPRITHGEAYFETLRAPNVLPEVAVGFTLFTANWKRDFPQENGLF